MIRALFGEPAFYVFPFSQYNMKVELDDVFGFDR
tara:strand:- start:151689 stop:151790 length:102 start_codon:yes stop_codon:yes gene_type:complete